MAHNLSLALNRSGALREKFQEGRIMRQNITISGIKSNNCANYKKQIKIYVFIQKRIIEDFFRYPIDLLKMNYLK